jgi:hypothetical protein
VSKWPDNKLARRALLLARKHGSDAGSEVWPLVWEFIHRQTAGRFARLADYVTAEFNLPLEDEERDANLSIIIQAIESGDWALLEPSKTFAAAVPAADAMQATTGSKT